jgi:hypothetical protein
MSVPDRSFILTRQLLLDDAFREQVKLHDPELQLSPAEAADAAIAALLLYNTADHLAELGIRDPTLERIRDRVRERRRAAGVEEP